MALLDTLNEYSWSLADTLRLSDFFEDRNIPPIILPVGVLVLIIVLLLSMGGAPESKVVEPVCGDGICQGEEATCPSDCLDMEVPEGKQLFVWFDRTPECQLTCKLYDSGGILLYQQRTSNNKVFFNSVDKESVYVTIDGAPGRTQRTSMMALEDDENLLDVVLNNDICEATFSTKGQLRLAVKDSSTNEQLTGVKVSIAETHNGQVMNYVARDVQVNGQYDFSLSHTKSYTIYAEKGGYEGYDGTGEEVMVPADKPFGKTIYLNPLTSEEKGDLEVCARSNVTPLESGLITVQGAADDFLLTGELSDADPSTEPSGPGCYVFTDIPTGKIVTASMLTPPTDCIPLASGTVTIEPSQRLMVYLDLDCQPREVGYVKVKVLGDEGQTLTSDSTITLWTQDGRLIPGIGIANSLQPEAGGYTEEVTVPINEPLYVWVRGLPDGYLDYRSDTFTVAQDEHKELDIGLDYTEPVIVTKNFTFNGISAPRRLATEQNFTVTVSEILYDTLALTEAMGKLDVSIGNAKCDVYYENSWKADCVAPSAMGTYDIILTAVYKKESGTYTLPTEVKQYTTGADLLTMTPVFYSSDDPPLDLYYEIRFNDTPVTELAYQNLSLKYIESPDAYPGELSQLEYLPDLGYWGLTADVPFRGKYSIDVELEYFKDGIYYTGFYVLTFTSESNSEKIEVDTRFSDIILPPLEGLLAETYLTFDGKEVYGLDNLELYMDRTYYTMNWDGRKHSYYVSMLSPVSEICVSPIDLVIMDQTIGRAEIYTIDPSRTKTGVCPMARDESCNSIEEVRKCIDDNNKGISRYSEDQLLTCVQSGCPISISIECPSNNKGDLDEDCELTEYDLDFFNQYLQIVTSSEDRNQLAECMDMDNDRDVDRDDLTCARNIVSTKWYGDYEAETNELYECSRGQMNGGFCFDMDLFSPLPGDLYYDGILDTYDEDIMLQIIEAYSNGVTAHKDILAFADFNQDDALDEIDLDCLMNFFTTDFTTGEILESELEIPLECMNIFDLGCGGLKGDLNDDKSIDVMDLLVVKYAAEGIMPLSVNLTFCADIDSDADVDEIDVLCLNNYIAGDEDRWYACLGCDEDLPDEAHHDYEICEDGFDNNCDGMTDTEDPNCDCGEHTPCEVVSDGDGGAAYGIEDGNYLNCVDFGTGYDWEHIDSINEKCIDSTQFGDSYKCGPDPYLCSFDYPEGFTYDDVTEGGFLWLLGGNTGPIGVRKKCSDVKTCEDGWEYVGRHSTSSCCNFRSSWTRAKHDCRFHWVLAYCRFKYDHVKEMPEGKMWASQKCKEATTCSPA